MLSLVVTLTPAAGVSSAWAAATESELAPADIAVVTAPAPGTTIAGTATLAATSLAPTTEFYVDGVAVGRVATEAGTAELGIDTFGLADGAHAVTAASCDELGCGLRSSEVTVLVDNAAPAFTSPVDGVSTAGIVTLAATSSSDHVRFTVDGRELGTVATISGQAIAAWDTYGVANGEHTLAAYGCDSAARCLTSAQRRVVTVVNPAPRITSPSDGRALGIPTVVEARTRGGSVRFAVDGAVVKTDLRAPFTFRLVPQDMRDGWHRIRARSCVAGGVWCGGVTSTIRVRTSRRPRITAPDAGTRVRNTVSLRAISPAPRVRFSVDGEWLGDPVRTVDGVATRRWHTFGYRDGGYRIRAHACGATCLPGSDAVDVRLASAVPTLLSPPDGARVGDRVTFHARAPQAAGIRFEVDGRTVGFDTGARHTASWSTARASDGSAHVVKARLCSRDGRRCGGPASSARRVVKQRLRPVITAITPSPFSPNGDGANDAAAVRFWIGEAQRVRVTIRRADGALVRGPVRVGSGELARGAHQFAWNGRRNDGTRVANGRYVVSLDTSKAAYGGTRTGHTQAAVAVDVTPPGLSKMVGSGATFHPAVDGDRDSFTSTIVVSEPAQLSLHVFDVDGREVAAIAGGTRGAGTQAMTWSGRSSSGVPLPDGPYTYVFRARDAAGNSRTSNVGRVNIVDYRWPRCDEVTSPYGPRWGRMHEGIDINGETGDPIYASRSGVVSFAGYDGGYGNIILLDHRDGVVTAYGHQTHFAVQVGQYVRQGEQIGYVGSTGHSTGSHLHFETRVNGQPIDPMRLLPPSC